MKNIFKVLTSLLVLFIIVLAITNVIYNKSYKEGHRSYKCCPDMYGIMYEFPCRCEKTTNIFKKMIIVLSIKDQ